MESYERSGLKPLTLILLFAAFAVAFVLLGSIAYAADMPVPADRELVAKLLPDYQMEEGIVLDENKMLLLMRNTQEELICVGCLYDKNERTWTMTQSAPLPEGTILGVENFVSSLGIPSQDYYACVDVNAFSDGTWGVTLMYPRNASLFQLGQNWISDGVWPLEGEIGFHPWNDITRIDWLSLPESYAEALGNLDTSEWAVVNNPNPVDRLNLREKQTASSGSLGKYYNGTPVRVISRGKEWTQVDILGVRGYMMTKYLAFGDQMKYVSYAGPWLMPKEEAKYLSVYDGVNAQAQAKSIKLDSFTGFYVLADLWGEWYHVWFYDLDMGGYVRQSDLWEGNG